MKSPLTLRPYFIGRQVPQMTYTAHKKDLIISNFQSFMSICRCSPKTRRKLLRHCDLHRCRVKQKYYRFGIRESSENDSFILNLHPDKHIANHLCSQSEIITCETVKVDKLLDCECSFAYFKDTNIIVSLSL